MEGLDNVLYSESEPKFKCQLDENILDKKRPIQSICFFLRSFNPRDTQSMQTEGIALRAEGDRQVFKKF
jgi:hypothetical protein